MGAGVGYFSFGVRIVFLFGADGECFCSEQVKGILLGTNVEYFRSMQVKDIFVRHRRRVFYVRQEANINKFRLSFMQDAAKRPAAVCCFRIEIHFNVAGSDFTISFFSLLLYNFRADLQPLQPHAPLGSACMPGDG